ncbi:hypothetical protein ABFQ45_19465, partial [Clostridioides difficile]
SNELQALGGIETYQTRYLYIQLLNITENDSFDAVSGKEESKSNSNNNVKQSNRILTDKQLTRLYAIANSVGVNKALLKEQVFKQLGKDIKDLNKSEYDAVCAAYEKQAFKGA